MLIDQNLSIKETKLRFRVAKYLTMGREVQ